LIQHRFEDGTFVLYSLQLKMAKLKVLLKGQWWIENGEFHELHFNSGKTDVLYSGARKRTKHTDNFLVTVGRSIRLNTI
jgi:hypothetical protein